MTPKALNSGEMEAWRAFIVAAVQVLEQLDRELIAEHDVSLADYEILVHLSESQNRRLTMHDLASSALVSKSRLSYRADRLEAKGLIRRTRCADDGRRIWAELTAKGLRKLELAYPSHLASVRRYVVDAGACEDLAAATRALNAMSKTLDSSMD